MPPPADFVKARNLVEFCRMYPAIGRNLLRYQCAGHTDSHGHQNHPGVHNLVHGPNLLKLCTRARVCPFHALCRKGQLEGDHSLGSRQKKHVERCVAKWIIEAVRVQAGEEGGQPNILAPSPVQVPAEDGPWNVVPTSPVLAPAYLPPLGHQANPIVLVSVFPFWCGLGARMSFYLF
jgi:hypothetical protein